ncbi:MAG: hypothetical protein CMF50_09990 [Legionellales bacterium]|nr:hypothetical protein [Legionellales bacterium]|tara:strand:+ start:40322 stop:40780 length:459 start_codon:yes stop_codon:yes gene_type:complete
MRRRKKAKSSLDCLYDSHDPLARNLVERVYQLSSLDEFLKQFLDEEVHPYIRVANYRDGEMVLAVTSPAFATMLRYQIPDLLAKLRRQPGLAALRQISYFIQPEEAPLPGPKVHRAANASPETAAHIKIAAQQLKKGRIRTILEKIADSISR